MMEDDENEDEKHKDKTQKLPNTHENDGKLMENDDNDEKMTNPNEKL